MNLDIESLRKLTQDSIAEGQRIQEAKRKREKEEAEVKRLQEIAEAEIILSRVPELCRQAAANGFYSANIYRLAFMDYATPKIGTVLGVEDLRTHRAKHVVKTLKELGGLEVHFNHNWDGGGERSWYDVTVSWKK